MYLQWCVAFGAPERQFFLTFSNIFMPHVYGREKSPTSQAATQPGATGNATANAATNSTTEP